jgi:hypothetical protein
MGVNPNDFVDVRPFVAKMSGLDFETPPWWRDPATIPRREFLYGRHYIRRAVSATIAGGGRGKTTLALFEAVTMASGYDLLTKQPLSTGPLRVWHLNGEEEQDELDRRVAAVCQHCAIAQTDLAGRLFVKSVAGETGASIAVLDKSGGAALNEPVIEKLRAFILRERIDVLMVDPLISFHSVRENDNSDMDLLIKRGFGGIASATNCAAAVFHHPGKARPGQSDASSVEDGRGASAIIWAVRSARVLNFMTPEEATKLGIAEDERRRYVRVALGKANSAPLGRPSWLHLVPELLPNNDEVVCASPWTPPDPFEGVTVNDMELAQRLAQTGTWRADSRSPQWFGYPVAKQLQIQVEPDGRNAPKDLARLKTILKTWLKNGVIATKERTDTDRKKRTFIVPGANGPAPVQSSREEEEEYTLQ